MIIWALAGVLVFLYVAKRIYDSDLRRYESARYRYDKPSRLGYSIHGAIWGFVIGTFVWIFASMIWTMEFAPDIEPHECWSFPIVASSDSTLTNGRWGIFGGYVNETPVYFYYRKYSDGAVRQGNIPARGTPIYQGEENAHIKVLKTSCDPILDDDSMEKHNTFLWGFADMRGWADGANRHYEIHVPDDSVVEHHTYDLGRN